MPNFQVIDAYGSVITIESSTVGSANRQVVAANITLGNTSVSGTVGASVVGQLPAGTAVLGSVMALQGTTPWITVNTGSIATVGMGSVITVWQNSSVFALQSGAQISSIVNTVPSSVLVGASIFGQLPAGTAVIGSVAALQGTSPWLISGNVSGSVVAFQGTTNWNIGSVYGNVSGSVVSYQGTSPWVIGSVFANVSGSVLAFQAGTSAPSAIGYLKRNDTLASTLGANGTYGEVTRDSAGRTIIKPFVADDTATFQFATSVVSTSVTLIQASTIGLRSYITDFFIANTGAANALITFTDGSTSILGYTIAPTVGGSNAPGIAIPIRTAQSQDLRFQAGTGTSVLYMTVRGYQAP